MNLVNQVVWDVVGLRLLADTDQNQNNSNSYCKPSARPSDGACLTQVTFLHQRLHVIDPDARLHGAAEAALWSGEKRERETETTYENKHHVCKQ